MNTFSTMEQQKNIYLECIARKGIALCRLILCETETAEANREELAEVWKTLVKFVDPTDAKVAVGRREKLQVFGNDYPTPDGTGVRDYIHITDLAIGHLKALNHIYSSSFNSWKAYNLGTGRGYSVLEMIKAFAEASGKQIKYDIVERRGGDIAECYADATLAKIELGWQATRDVMAMCRDTWNWQKKNPKGFQTSS